MRHVTVALLLGTAVLGVPLAAWGQNKKPKSGNTVSESGLEYQLFKPSKPGAGRPGLIIFLHGTGGNAGCWAAYVSAANQRGYYAVTPWSTGTGDKKAGNLNGDNMRRWADLDIPKLAGLAREMQRKYGCDPRRTFIAGYSNGGFYSTETAITQPETFSAALSMGGGCNAYNFPEQAKNVGVYFCHGTADNNVQVQVARDASERLKKAGVKDVILKEYPGGGHDVFEKEIPAYFDWLAKKKRVLTPGAGVAWDTDLQAALKTAAESNKKVLAYFYSEKDSDSDVADNFEFEVFKDKDVTDAASEFVRVKVDREKIDPKEWKILKSTLAVIDSNKKIAHKFDTIVTPKEAADKLKTFVKKK